MQKIKLMTDSTSDIDPELEQSLDLSLIHISEPTRH